MLKKNTVNCFIFALTCILLTGIASAQLSKESIFKVIQQSMKDINKCYQSALMKDDTLQGKLMMSFIVEKDGVVKRAEIKETSIQSDGMKQCIVTAFKAMTFPQADKITRVVYPLIFQKSGSGQAGQSKVNQAGQSKVNQAK